MFSWLSILAGILKIATFVAQIVHNKQLMDAGAAKATLQGIQNVQKQIQLALAAGNAADDDSVSDPFSKD